MALIPKSNLIIIRVCCIRLFTIQPARHLVKKPPTRHAETSAPQSVNPSRV